MPPSARRAATCHAFVPPPPLAPAKCIFHTPGTRFARLSGEHGNSGIFLPEPDSHRIALVFYQTEVRPSSRSREDSPDGDGDGDGDAGNGDEGLVGDDYEPEVESASSSAMNIKSEHKRPLPAGMGRPPHAQHLAQHLAQQQRGLGIPMPPHGVQMPAMTQGQDAMSAQQKVLLPLLLHCRYLCVPVWYCNDCSTAGTAALHFRCTSVLAA